MIDAPGPWATGPFTLVEGYSRITAESAVIRRDPFACIWLQREDRTPIVRLHANPNYWDAKRGPYLREVVFHNDISPERALELVCATEGAVDIVTEVPPAQAARVERSEHAKLVEIDALRIVVGIINRDAEGLPLGDRRARLALNHAVERDALIEEALFGRAEPLAGLTPSFVAPMLIRPKPYAHDAGRAAELWREALGDAPVRPLRIAAPDELELLARWVAADITDALGVETEITIYRGVEEKLESRRRLAERDLPRPWDILLHAQGAQASDAPPLELHRAFVGESGEWRAGPVVDAFEDLYAEFVRRINPLAQMPVAHRIDKFVYDEALALFLCAPHALYAVNRHVDFTAYRTTFELAECRVGDKHWSRRNAP